MKKQCHFLLFIFFCFCMIPNTIKAESCDYEQLAKLKNYASNVQYDYDYAENNGNVVFYIRFTNISKFVTLIDETTGKQYTNLEEVRIDGFTPGKSYPFVITTSNVPVNSIIRRKNIWGEWVEYERPTDINDSCRNTLLKRLYITLPSYNPYYKLPVCEGVEDYDMCFKWQKHELSEEEFVQTVTEYKERKNKKEEVAEEEPTMVEKIIDMVRTYFYIPLAIVIVIVLIVVYVRKKREKEEGW